jgi:hypothetical protein
MEERIVQISEYDYQKLYNKANLNEEKIKELAEEYYKERGVFSIDITQNLINRYGVFTTHKVHTMCFENGNGKTGPLKPLISEKDRRRISSLLDEVIAEKFNERYGDVLEFEKKLNSEMNIFYWTKYILYGLAFSGWGVAVASFICNN